MKIKHEIQRLQNLAEPTISISKNRFASECKEYCYLYKSVYNTLKNPNMKLISVYGEYKVYLERLSYIDAERPGIAKVQVQQKKIQGVCEKCLKTRKFCVEK